MRMCDEECRQQHQDIQAEVHQVNQSLEAHIGEMHAHLVDEKRIKEWDRRLHDEIEELAAAVLGPRRTDLAGGGRNEDEGLVGQWKHFTTNGGVPAKLGVKEKGAIYVAVVIGVANVLVQVIEHWSPGP